MTTIFGNRGQATVRTYVDVVDDIDQTLSRHYSTTPSAPNVLIMSTIDSTTLGLLSEAIDALSGRVALLASLMTLREETFPRGRTSYAPRSTLELFDLPIEVYRDQLFVLGKESLDRDFGLAVDDIWSGSVHLSLKPVGPKLRRIAQADAVVFALALSQFTGINLSTFLKVERPGQPVQTITYDAPREHLEIKGGPGVTIKITAPDGTRIEVSGGSP